MIIGRFDERGRPFVEGRVTIPSIQVDERVLFLLDTGADSTCLHPRDTDSVGIPFRQLGNAVSSTGVGGRSRYFREPALLAFGDESRSRPYVIDIHIAEPNESSDALSSLLGRNVINHWYMEYDPSDGRLECTVRHADYTMDAPRGQFAPARCRSNFRTSLQVGATDSSLTG